MPESATSARANFTWLGHAAVRVELGDGTTIVVDPFLTGNPSTPAALSWATNSSSKFRRILGDPPIPPTRTLLKERDV